MSAMTKRVSGREWQRRSEQMLSDNLQLQAYGRECTEALMAIHKVACEAHRKMRLLIMPGIKGALEEIATIAGPFAAPVPDITVKLDEGGQKKITVKTEPIGDGQEATTITVKQTKPGEPEKVEESHAS